MKIKLKPVNKGLKVRTASLVGPRGPQGLRGERGERGPIGRQGPKGDRGVQGPTGPQGPIGFTGLSGKDGLDGKDGAVGPMPKHQVKGNQIRFEEDVGVWGKWINLGTTTIQGGGLAGIKAEGVQGLAAFIQEQLDLSSTYTKLIDTVSDIKYIGEADAGTSSSSPKWRIKRIQFLSGSNVDDIEIKWASGSTAFDKVWDDRASYTYS